MGTHEEAAPDLAHRNFQCFVYGTLTFWQVNSQEAVLELGGDILALSSLGEGKAALKCAVTSFDAVKAAARCLLLEFALARDANGAVFQLHFHILLLHLRQLGLDRVFLFALLDIDQRAPFGARDRFIDGWHQHPTQALLDAYTITRERHSGNDLSGVRVAIVGDVKHSRVARSTTHVLTSLGATVTFVAPSTLLPNDVSAQAASATSDLDDVIPKCDVLYMLRMQKERMDHALIPDIGEYCERFALTSDRAKRLSADALVMHPGPMNRGVEMQVDPSDLVQSRILTQVTNGIAVRMAVLFSLLGSGSASTLSQGNES